MRLIRFAIVAASILICAPAFSQVKPCEDLKSEIEAKLKEKGVAAYTLEIVPADKDVKDARIAGTCNGGKNKITYVKATAAPNEPTKGTGEVKEPRVKPSQMPKLTVFNPMGTPPPITLISQAPRLDKLEGKTIYFINTGYIGTDRLMAVMMDWFKANHPKTAIVYKDNTSGAGLSEISKALEAEIAEKGDAAIVGLGH
jgi:hypothetical protein